MHPLIAKWIEAERRHAEAAAAAKVAETALEEARGAADAVVPDGARLRAAVPSDVVVGAVLWNHLTRDADGPCDRHVWLRVDGVTQRDTGSFLSGGAPYLLPNGILVEADAEPSPVPMDGARARHLARRQAAQVVVPEDGMVEAVRAVLDRRGG